MPERRPPDDNRPSDAVIDELLRAFEANDLTKGNDVDLDSPEVEALLSGEQTRPPEEASAETPDASARHEPETEPEPEPRTEPETTTEPEPRAEPEVTPGFDRDADEGVVRIVPAGAGSGRNGTEPDADTPSDDAGEAPSGESGGSTPTDSDRPRVVINADDGSSDPVYVDGELAPDRAASETHDASSTVFIDDDAMEVSDAVGSAEAARATGIEPKLRERRVAVQRAEGRKRLRWVFVVIGALVVILGGLIALGSSLFTIGDVEVEGADIADGAVLEQIIEDLADENVWGVDLEAYRERLERIPAVGNVRISKGFFGGATIEIDEREPVAAFAGDDGRFRVMDAEGRVLRVIDRRPNSRPLVTTLDDEEAPNTEPGSFADPGFGNAGVYASMLTPAVSERLEQISVARDGSDTRLLLQGGSEVLLGDGSDAVAKMARLENEIVQYDGDLPARLDVSTDEVTNVPG